MSGMVKSIIPLHWDVGIASGSGLVNARIEDEDDLIHLGTRYIGSLAGYWEDEATYYLYQLQDPQVIRENPGIGQFYKDQLKVAIDNVNYLQLLIESAVVKPLVPKIRRGDFFKVGQEIVCFFNVEADELFSARRAVLGSVVNCRYGLGLVDVKTVAPAYKQSEGLGKHSLSFGVWSYQIIPRADYDYLIANPDFRKRWVEWSQGSITESDFESPLLGK